jgi:hypothetical protein
MKGAVVKASTYYITNMMSVKSYFVKQENLIKFVKCLVTCGVPKFVTQPAQTRPV